MSGSRDPWQQRPRGTYQSDGQGTSWLKIKNPDYSQMAGRRELFELAIQAYGGVSRMRSCTPLSATLR